MGWLWLWVGWAQQPVEGLRTGGVTRGARVIFALHLTRALLVAAPGIPPVLRCCFLDQELSPVPWALNSEQGPSAVGWAASSEGLDTRVASPPSGGTAGAEPVQGVAWILGQSWGSVSPWSRSTGCAVCAKGGGGGPEEECQVNPSSWAVSELQSGFVFAAEPFRGLGCSVTAQPRLRGASAKAISSDVTSQLPSNLSQEGLSAAWDAGATLPRPRLGQPVSAGHQGCRSPLVEAVSGCWGQSRAEGLLLL